MFQDSRRQRHLSSFRRAAQASVEENPAALSKEPTNDTEAGDGRIKRTLAGLDALLGIEDESLSKKPIEPTQTVEAVGRPGAIKCECHD
jgi:hypothetical protein